MKIDFYVDFWPGQKDGFYASDNPIEKTEGFMRYKFTIDIPFEEVDKDLGEVQAKEEKE